MLDANDKVLTGDVADMFNSLQLVNLHFRNYLDIRDNPPVLHANDMTPLMPFLVHQG